MSWPLSVKHAAKITFAQYKCRTFQSIIYPADKNNFIGISSILAWGKSRVGLPPPFIAKNLNSYLYMLISGRHTHCLHVPFLFHWQIYGQQSSSTSSPRDKRKKKTSLQWNRLFVCAPLCNIVTHWWYFGGQFAPSKLRFKFQFAAWANGFSYWNIVNWLQWQAVQATLPLFQRGKK